MKHIKALLPIAILAAASLAAADFFEGFDKGSSEGESSASGQGYSNAMGQGYGSGSSDVSGWGQGKGDADGSVDFSVTFKGKGSTDVASDAYTGGSGNTDASVYGYSSGYGSGYTNNNSTWGYYGTPSANYYGYGVPYYGYPAVFMGYGYPTLTQAPSFDQVQRQMQPQAVSALTTTPANTSASAPNN